MKRLEFVKRAQALAFHQCAEFSHLTEKEFNEIKKSVVTKESSEEVERYRVALQILTHAAEDADSTFIEISRNFEEEDNEN